MNTRIVIPLAALGVFLLGGALFGNSDSEDAAPTPVEQAAPEHGPSIDDELDKLSKPIREERAPSIDPQLDCSYLLEGSGKPYRFVAGGDIENTGNIGVHVRVRARWRQLGSFGVSTTRRYRVRRGQTREIQITVPTTVDGILAHQKTDGRCSATARVTRTFGRPPLG